MTVELSPETERLVKEEIERGRFHSVEEVIVEAVYALHEQSKSVSAPQPKKPLGEFLLESPLRDSGLKLERQQDYPRPIDL